VDKEPTATLHQVCSVIRGKADCDVQFVRRHRIAENAHRNANDSIRLGLGGRIVIGTGSSVDKARQSNAEKGRTFTDCANRHALRGDEG